MGLIHDGHGYRMSPSHSTKSGRRHRYYISRAMMDGRPEERPPIHRVNALQIEALVINAVWKHLDREAIATEAQARDLIRAHVARVDIRSGSIDVHVVSRNDQSVTPGSDLAADGTPDDRRHTSSQPAILTIPWTRRPSRMPRQILPAADADTHDDRRPIRAETRATLVQAIARGRRWLRDLIEGAVTSPQKIAVREGCSPRQVNMTISLAFLAPSLVQAAIDGTLPRGIGVASLRDMLAEWSKQHARLGLAD